MNFVELFIRRPVATTLLTIGVALSGAMAFRLLPVSPLPSIDFPTISVSASVAGASPETMAATVATPLERALGRIAGITEMTSSSSLGSSNVVIQFDLSRDIDGAARDVQAALNAARSLLPTSLTSNPTYRQYNPSDSPVIILGLTSDRVSRGDMYNVATTVLAQKIAQIEGVGDVTVGGGALPGVRVEVNPTQLNSYGISLDQVRNAIAATNVNKAIGLVESGDKRWQIQSNSQALKAADYSPLILAYSKSGAPVRLSDVANVTDSVENLRQAALLNDTPAIVLYVTRQPGANIIETVDRIKALMPALQASLPLDVNMSVANDRSVTIRSSLHDVEVTLIISVILVTLVVYLFLRDLRATLIPAVAVPVSLIGTFGIIYMMGFSLNNLSLMALTIATGFVVDDAIVVLENIARHIENGVPRFKAAMLGAKEVSFTVISMSISLIAVFIPILLMGGIVGRIFREFAVTLSVAILVSMVVSLTATPMMCARLLRAGHTGHSEGKKPDLIERFINWMLHTYDGSLKWALRHSLITIFLLTATIGLNIFLYIIIPTGFFPSQDTGALQGSLSADQSTSFLSMNAKMAAVSAIVNKDPAVATVISSVGSSGGRGGSNSARFSVTLKPLSERSESADEIVARLRMSTAHITGAQLFLNSVQDINIGGRGGGGGAYLYTVQADSIDELNVWDAKIRNALTHVPEITDVNADPTDKGLQTTLNYNRDRLSRLGLSITQINNTLYDAFGQRQVSTLFQPLNQYHVVMTASPNYLLTPDALNSIYMVNATAAPIPFRSFATYKSTNTSLSVNHQSQFVVLNIPFNLALGVPLSAASAAITKAMSQIGLPSTVIGSFQGTAKQSQETWKNMPLLILAAITAVYLVLGILYESYIHPITILTTLPSAGVGALVALMICHTDFNLISVIGVLLLIGIVKKNAIMMIDFAIEAERSGNLTAKEAIYKACLLRFRPIMMTTIAAMLGALPLAIGFGEGAELRRPLGIAIVGGLVFSQMLTLYTTPVVYIYFDRLRVWLAGRREHRRQVTEATAHQPASESSS